MYCSENSRWNFCPPLEDETLEAKAGQLPSLGLGDAFRDVTRPGGRGGTAFFALCLRCNLS